MPRRPFKGAKHSRRKVESIRRKIGESRKTMNIRVAISRTGSAPAGSYFATACVSGERGKMSSRGNERRANSRCAFSHGNTPTRAAKSALAVLAKVLK